MLVIQISVFRYILVLTTIVACSRHVSAEIHEICLMGTFTATCAAEDEVIFIRNASYGRMRLSRCISKDFGAYGCGVSVLRQTDRICSGRPTCQIHVSDKSFDNPKTNCSKELPVYFEVAYECLKVVTAPADHDCSQHGDVTITQPSGFIASYTTIKSGYGGANCPWRVEVPSVQRINMTLIDFTQPTASNDTGENSSDQICRTYARLSERHETTNAVTICGSDKRKSYVYTSKTNAVEVTIPLGANRDVEYYFLIKFEAIGCLDPIPPEHGWVNRQEDKVIMGCNHSNETWSMTCSGTKWIGQCGSCPPNPHQCGCSNSSTFVLSTSLITIMIGAWFSMDPSEIF